MMTRERQNEHAQRNANQPLRIALYSHDTCGLGHMRRNLLIAETLVEHFPNVNILLITGAREVSAFRFPDRVDAVSLPSLYKKANKSYSARSFELDISELIHIRASIIRTSIEVFNPDVFIVDKVPRGTMGELDKTLEYLADQTSTKCVLGLRDILDNPEITTTEWKANSNAELIERFYDDVWVYGDEQVYDLREAYGFSSEVADKITYAGYLNPSSRLQKAAPSEQDTGLLEQLGDQFYLCAVGGGQDGAELATAFSHASFPEGVRGLIVTGPHMPSGPRKRLKHIVESKSHLTLVNFLPEPLHVYQAAERIVSMGGYNTTLELLGLGVNALIVPRVSPREEQLIRSRALQALGLLDHLHPDELTSESISDWFRTTRKKTSAYKMIDMGGLQRIPELVQHLVSQVFVSQKESPISEIHHALS